MALPLLNILSMLNILSTRLVRGTFFLGTYGGACGQCFEQRHCRFISCCLST